LVVAAIEHLQRRWRVAVWQVFRTIGAVVAVAEEFDAVRHWMPVRIKAINPVRVESRVASVSEMLIEFVTTEDSVFWIHPARPIGGVIAICALKRVS
jgi:hypothetical protein